MPVYVRITPLWIRIFLMVFGLVTLVIVFFSYRIIQVSIEHNMEREITSSLNNHNMIYNALKMYESTIIDGEPHQKLLRMTAAVMNYGRYYTDNKSRIALTNMAGEKLFSSIPLEEEVVMGLHPSTDGRRSYVIRDIGPRTVLFVSGWMEEIGNQHFRLDYARDITDLINDQKSLAIQISFWVFLGMTVFAMALCFLVRQALCPLAQLSKQAQAIAKGRYQHRITIKPGDEIAQLAGDFNHMAEAIQANMELLQRGVQEREAFIASLAHELKTPLTSIMGYTSLLQNYHLDQKDMEQALMFIHSETKRLDSMSIKLLDLFRLGDGRQLNKKQVAVSSLLQELKIISQFSLSRKGQSLEVESSVPRVMVDQELFLVLLHNLVENSSKASENDSVIRVRVYTEASSVVFCIQDSGSGIPKEHVNNVFQPFFMLDRARDRKRNGHGLGLSLSKSIAEAHQGSIYLESTLDEGTTVYIRLPNQEFLQNADIPPIKT